MIKLIQAICFYLYITNRTILLLIKNITFVYIKLYFIMMVQFKCYKFVLLPLTKKKQ